MSDNDIPVMLTRTDEGEMLEVRQADTSQGFVPVLGVIAGRAREVLGLKPGATVGARRFECHPDDLQLLDDAAHKFVDGSGFMRAFAHDEDHNFLVNARFREVGEMSPAAIHPASIAMLAMQAETQRSLERIEAALESIDSKLNDLARRMEVEAEADVLAAVELIAEVWERYQSEGIPSETDWERILHLEHTLRKRHREVLSSLDAIAKSLRFTTINDAQSSCKVNPNSVMNLVALEVYMRRGLMQHFHIALAIRQSRGEGTQGAAEAARRTLEEFGTRAHEAYESIRAANSEPQEKNFLEMLKTKGIPAGYRDNRVVRAAKENRLSIQNGLPFTATENPSLPVRHLGIEVSPQAWKPSFGLEV